MISFEIQVFNFNHDGHGVSLLNFASGGLLATRRNLIIVMKLVLDQK